MKRVLKPVSGLVLFSVLFCFAGTDLALAQQVSVMAAQESEEKELPLVVSVLIVAALAYALWRSDQQSREKWRESVEQYFAQNPDREKYKDAVLSRKIMLGMNEEEVILAWGKPNDINRSVYTSGVHEQWVYRKGSYSAYYVYLENGKLTAMQDF
ncbi:MAG TPA: hypothetical protein PKH75_15135 [Bacillota bacterium]|nr:hypothetical protein [Bacillota bacterium]